MTFRSIAAAIFLLTAVLGASNTIYSQRAKADTAQLRKSFALATAKDFELVTTRIVNYDDKWRGGAYMLFHVKPRIAGIYKLKHTYRMRDDFYYEGEDEMVIRIGARECDRDLRAEEAKTMFCLGDTVIIPIRLPDSSKHAFTLDSNYLKTVDRTGAEPPSYLGILTKEIVANPLGANLEYLGFHRSEEMSRSATGGGFISYNSFFKAKKAGRFNLNLSANAGEGTDDPGYIQNFTNSVPVIIVNPGTPVTALVPHEKITSFTKGRAYSADNFVSYQTNLLILQPGEFISEVYYMLVVPRGKHQEIPKYQALDKDPVPVIQKLPFFLKKDGSYNDWIAGYLP